MENSRNIKSIIGFSCSVLGIVFSFLPYVCCGAIVFSIAGVIIGSMGMDDSKALNKGYGVSIAALVLGIIGILTGALALLVFLFAGKTGSPLITDTLQILS